MTQNPEVKINIAESEKINKLESKIKELKEQKLRFQERIKNLEKKKVDNIDRGEKVIKGTDTSYKGKITYSFIGCCNILKSLKSYGFSEYDNGKMNSESYYGGKPEKEAEVKKKLADMVEGIDRECSNSHTRNSRFCQDCQQELKSLGVVGKYKYYWEYQPVNNIEN